MNLDSDTGRSLGDTPIRPETINAYELGLKTQFADNRARLNAAIFYNDYNDQQINQAIAGQFVVLNVDSITYGGEVEVNLLPFEGTFIDLSVGYLQTETENPTANPAIGSELPQAPEWTGNIGVRKEWVMSNGSVLSLGADGRFVSSRFFNLANSASDDSYFVTDAQASYSFGDEGRFKIALWGKNIFNELYFVNRFSDFGGPGVDTVYLSNPATYGVTLTARM